MGFRKSKAETQEKAKWIKFISKNSELISEIGLPADYTNSLEWFQDFLMHGYIDHHHDPHQVSTDDFTIGQFEKFEELIKKYFEAGYDDPGIMVISHEKREEYAKRFPNQFYPYGKTEH